MSAPELGLAEVVRQAIREDRVNPDSDHHLCSYDDADAAHVAAVVEVWIAGRLGDEDTVWAVTRTAIDDGAYSTQAAARLARTALAAVSAALGTAP